MVATIVLAHLLSRMASVNAGLYTYTATLQANVRMLSFPFLETQIVGTIYRKEPNHEKLVITSGLPGVAQQFANLYPNIVAPASWQATFGLHVVSDDGTAVRLRLTPIKRGNVEHIDATVDERSALVTVLRWNYRNGGWAQMTQTYAAVGGDEVPVTQHGQIEEPGYVADIDATVSDYHLNAPIADGVFAQ